jgi:hypothetical protein
LKNYLVYFLVAVLDLIIVELPAFLLRLRRTNYGPVYFQTFPFRIINEQLASYIGEDFTENVSIENVSKQKPFERKQLLGWLCVACLLTPCLIGLFSSFLLPYPIIILILALIIAYRGILELGSLRKFGRSSLGNRFNNIFLAFVQVAYLSVIFLNAYIAYCLGIEYLSMISSILVPYNTSITIMAIVLNLILYSSSILMIPFLLRNEISMNNNDISRVDVLRHYVQFKPKLDRLIHSQRDDPFVLAIMATETYFRSRAQRFLEYFVWIILKSLNRERAKYLSVGRAQVQVRHWINFGYIHKKRTTLTSIRTFVN